MLAFDTVIDDWWNTTLTFPITLKNLVVALCTHLNVLHNIPQSFTNYDYTITARPVYFQGVTAAELLGYIQEVAGGFFKADRNGIIQYYSIQTVSVSDDAVIITDGNAGKEEYSYRQIVGDLYIADYDVEQIDKLQVRGTEDDIGIIVGTGTNAYIITGNVLMYTLTETTGSTVVTNIFNAIKGMEYTPFSAKVMGLPYVTVGDSVSITTLKNKNATAPVLQRVLSGAKLSFDAFSANGEKEREEVPSVNRELKTLNQKTHEIVNTVEEFSSTITNIETDISGLDTRVTNNTSAIQQNASQIALKVSQSDYNGNEIISLINLDTSGVKIQGSHLVIDTSSLDLTFGSTASHITIQATSNNDGVLFTGNGKIDYTSSGEFYVSNTDANSYEANRLKLTNSSTESSSEMYNYFNNVKANDIDLSATSTSNTINLVNNRLGADKMSNKFEMTCQDFYRQGLINYQYNFLTSQGKEAQANAVSLYAGTIQNSVTISNYKLGTDAYTGNRIQMICNATENSINITNRYNPSATTEQKMTFNSSGVMIDSPNTMTFKTNSIHVFDRQNNIEYTGATEYMPVLVDGVRHVLHFVHGLYCGYTQ